MCERMRRITYIKSNVHLFALLLAITLLSLSGTALAGEKASAHPTWPGPGQLFRGHVLSAYRPLTRADRSGHCHYEARRLQCRAHGRPFVGFF